MKDIVVITGGTSGLGYELVKKFIEKDFIVCNLARNIKKLNELNKSYPNNHIGFAGNITDEKFVKDAISKICKTGGTLKYLINNASSAVFKSVTQYTETDIKQCMEGLQGMIICSTQVLLATNEKDIKIVNIMSSAALKGNKNEEVYCAVKWGERGYTESLKTTYKGTSVKIIGVYPGGMNTNFWQNNRNYVSEEKQKTFMNPKDVAQVIFDNVVNSNNLTVADIIIERK